MEIMPASILHLDIIYNLICELEGEMLNKDAFSKIYRGNLEDKNIFYLVAVRDEAVIGFASLHIQNLLHHCAKIGEIQEIIISKTLQGAGVGSALFNKIADIAAANGCSDLEVCCSRARVKTHPFYLKQGMIKSHYKFTYTMGKTT